jgi:hypothetical protein
MPATYATLPPLTRLSLLPPLLAHDVRFSPLAARLPRHAAMLIQSHVRLVGESVSRRWVVMSSRWVVDGRLLHTPRHTLLHAMVFYYTPRYPAAKLGPLASVPLLLPLPPSSCRVHVCDLPHTLPQQTCCSHTHPALAISTTKPLPSLHTLASMTARHARHRLHQRVAGPLQASPADDQSQPLTTTLLRHPPSTRRHPVHPDPSPA